MQPEQHTHAQWAVPSGPRSSPVVWKGSRVVVLFRKVQKKTEYLGCGIRRSTVLAKPAPKQRSSHCKLEMLWEYCSSCFGEPGSGSFTSWQPAISIKKSFLLLCYQTILRNVVYLRSVELQFIFAVSKSDTHLKHARVGAWLESNEKIKQLKPRKTYMHHQVGVQNWSQ